MIVIDTNALVVLLLGLMDPNIVSTHSKTSIYTKQDFFNLLEVIKDFKNLLVLPNIWTEVDNLLNKFGGNRKYLYVKKITELIKESSEKYINTKSATEKHHFMNLGLTDTLILDLAKDCKFIITSDSQLSDYANALGFNVYDMIKYRNTTFKQ
ncbi:MAG TPA: hypothetical protein DER05_14555 [Lutibacter sp.]|nr:hypothetical protein [Lutibacter sp.]